MPPFNGRRVSRQGTKPTLFTGIFFINSTIFLTKLQQLENTCFIAFTSICFLKSVEDPTQ